MRSHFSDCQDSGKWQQCLCQDERVRWTAFIGVLVFYMLPPVILRIEYPEIVHVSCWGMLTSELCAGSETLTSDARIVESTKEDNVVLPKRHSRCGLFKKRV